MMHSQSVKPYVWFARQVHYFLHRLFDSPLGDWIFRGSPPSADVAYGELGFARSETFRWDYSTSKWKHESENGEVPPRLNKYWSDQWEYSWSLDFDTLRASVLGLPATRLHRFESSTVHTTWRNTDSWGLIKEFEGHPKSALRDLVVEAEELFRLPGDRVQEFRPLSELIRIAMELGDTESWFTDRHLNQVLEELTAKYVYSNEESFQIVTILQPFLALLNRRVTSHGISTSFCFYDSDHLESCIKGANQLVEDLRHSGYESCLAFGSVLGILRDHHLIGHDCDIDIVVGQRELDEKSFLKFREGIIDSLSNLGWEVFPYSPDLKMNFMVRSAGYRHRFGGPSVEVFDVFPLRGVSETGEINFYHERNVMVWEDLFPPFKINTDGGTVWLPARPSEYLEKQYGPSWREFRPFDRPY